MALRVGELDDSSLIARQLMPCHFHVAASPAYWQRAGMPEHPSDLSGHNCLIYSQSPKANSWIFADKNGDNLSVKVKGNLRSDAGRVLLDAAVNGQGVLIGPTYMLADAMLAGQLETVLEAYYRPAAGLYAVYPYSKLVSSKVRAFVDHMVEAWGEPR